MEQVSYYLLNFNFYKKENVKVLVTSVICRTNIIHNFKLKCSTDQIIQVKSANYGQKFPDICQAVGKDESVKNIQQYCSESIQTFNVISNL
jgi:hypothetical protein